MLLNKAVFFFLTGPAWGGVGLKMAWFLSTHAKHDAMSPFDCSKASCQRSIFARPFESEDVCVLACFVFVFFGVFACLCACLFPYFVLVCSCVFLCVLVCSCVFLCVLVCSCVFLCV